MAYIFTRAELGEIPALYAIIKKRVKWMDDKGISQWNTTDYLNTYPIPYFEAHQKAGNLYVAKHSESNKICGVMVLMPFDTRWKGYDKFDAYYVHNFATDPAVRGLGSFMLTEAEKIAACHGKDYLRLDCPSHNEYLNNFYEKKSYISVGECIDGSYKGNRREKRLSSIRKDALELILSRSSYRGKFLSDSVPRNHLKLIVESGIAAPSGCNCQTPAFVIVDDDDKCCAIKKLFPRPSCITAPAFILVFTQQIPGIDGHFYNIEDYAAAIENMLLAIKALGYESCWYQGGVRSFADDFKALVQMPDNFRFVCLLPVGKAADEVLPQKNKKQFEERAWFNSFINQ